MRSQEYNNSLRYVFILGLLTAITIPVMLVFAKSTIGYWIEIINPAGKGKFSFELLAATLLLGCQAFVTAFATIQFIDTLRGFLGEVFSKSS